MDRPANGPTPTPRPANQGGGASSGAPGQDGGGTKIRHTESTLSRAASGTGPGSETIAPVPIPTPAQAPPVNREIRTFGSTVDAHQEEHWKRAPQVTGSGASHCKTFHSKLTEDALRYMDQQINDWLDEHPDYEVKFVTSSIGTFTGKIKEPHLVCQVWV